MLIMGVTKFYPPLDTILMTAMPNLAMPDLWQIWRTTEEKIAARLKAEGKRFDMISYMTKAQESPV